jgi:transglutaminase/protease-like cytokinesis protein 3
MVAASKGFILMRTPISPLVRILVGLYFLLGLPVQLPAQVHTLGAQDFHRADSVAALYSNHSLANLKNLADKLTQPFSTDVDKFRAIFSWVCQNIENDYGLYAKNKAKREKLYDQPEALGQWNQKLNPIFFQKLLREHKTICTGYAYLVQELAFHAGLTCQIIDGYGRTANSNIGGTGIANHSWNAVQLDHQWYLCDATWSSGAIDTQQKKFIKQFSDAYFLTPPSLFALNHYPVDTAWMLLQDKPTLSAFLHGPLVYKSSFKYGILPISPTTFLVEVKKGETTTFRFSKKNNLEVKQVEFQLVQGTSSTSAYPEMCQDGSGLNTIDYVFTHQGTFVVHLLFNDEYVLTYSLRVSK